MSVHSKYLLHVISCISKCVSVCWFVSLYICLYFVFSAIFEYALNLSNLTIRYVINSLGMIVCCLFACLSILSLELSSNMPSIYQTSSLGIASCLFLSVCMSVFFSVSLFDSLFVSLVYLFCLQLYHRVLTHSSSQSSSLGIASCLFLSLSLFSVSLLGSLVVSILSSVLSPYGSIIEYSLNLSILAIRYSIMSISFGLSVCRPVIRMTTFLSDSLVVSMCLVRPYFLNPHH